MNFDNISSIYDLLYKNKDYEQETNHILRYLKKDLSSKTILEYGIGTANHAILLRRHGFKVTGVELNSKMNEIAISKGFESFNSDMAFFESEKQYDYGLALFHVFSYLTEDDKIETFFKNLYKNLKPGSLFLFDTWFTPAVYNILPSIKFFDSKNEEFIIKRKSSPTLDLDKNTVNVNFTFNITKLKSNENSSYEENHLMRHFSINEIKRFVEKSGFKYLKSEEIISLNPPSLKTWSLLHIIKK